MPSFDRIDEVNLPPWKEREDLTEGALIWKGFSFWVWFETILNHIWLWAADRAALASLRDALLPIA